MDKITQVPGLILLATVGLIVCILSHELRCWRLMRCLEQQRLTQQRLIEFLDAELHTVLPDQLITENCHTVDRKYPLNLSSSTNDFSLGFFDTGIIKGNTH